MSSLRYVDLTQRQARTGEVFLLGHPHFPQVVFVRSGHGCWHGEEERLAVREGDLLILPAGAREKVGGAISWEVLTASATLWPRLPEGAELMRHDGLSAEFAALSKGMDREKSARGAGWMEAMAAMAQLFLIALHRRCLIAREHAPSPACSLSRVREYIRGLNRHFVELETFETVAGKLHLSPRRFSELFREVTGTTWLKYIHHLRVRRAKSLLATREDAISQIARQSGFEEETTFYRVFKNYVGVTPGQWREQIRQTTTPIATNGVSLLNS